MHTLLTKHIKSLALSSCIAALFAASPSYAQTEATPPPPEPQPSEPQPADAAQDFELTDIVVTAQKRSQSVQDVPISIVAITGRELSRRGVQSLTDVARSVPGLRAF